jgi:hypothetical protein
VSVGTHEPLRTPSPTDPIMTSAVRTLAMTDDTGTGGDDVNAADTFGVSIGVDDDAFRVLVHVPPSLDAAWDDRDAFQRLVETAVWERLDRDATVRAVDGIAGTGERVGLGTVTLTPEGAVVDHTLSVPSA